MPSVPRTAGLPMVVVKMALVPSAENVIGDVPQFPALKKRLVVAVASSVTGAAVAPVSA